jgi:hypothetical protein
VHFERGSRRKKSTKVWRGLSGVAKKDEAWRMKDEEVRQICAAQ